MDNPQLFFPAQTMYAYDTHQNIPWNDLEYQPVREYLDPRQQMTERKYRETPKGGKDQNYVTKRGFYMDYQIKTARAQPAPDAHPPKDLFDQAGNKKKSRFHKLDLSLSKRTYLDEIAKEQKLRGTPAPGAYNLNKTSDQIEEEKKSHKSKKRYEGQRHFFYEDDQFLANSLAQGSGNCNPHLDVPHLKMNKTNHKFWIDKHKKEDFKLTRRMSVQPASGTYTPIPVTETTFDRIKTADQLKKKRKDNKFHGFGSDARFSYDRINKKKIVEKRPSPSGYNLVLEWKGKNMDLKTNNWIRSRSMGPSKSVYH